METTEKPLFKKVTEGYTFKILLLIGLVLLLLIPLAMIRGIINERRYTASSAEADIMEAWGRVAGSGAVHGDSWCQDG